MVRPENGTFRYGSKPLEGVFFGIYTDEDIKAADGRVILSKDSLIGVIKTNKDGKATLRSALVSGKCRHFQDIFSILLSIRLIFPWEMNQQLFLR